MNIGFTRNQELAAEHLHTIAPLISLARKSFVALNGLSSRPAVGTIEVAARDSSLSLAKAVLLLEHRLKIAAQDRCRCIGVASSVTP